MAEHIDTGKLGEALAEAYFREKGFLILHRNWRYRNLEIDLITSREQVLHFIEVKTKTSARFGFPEEEVDEKKFRHLVNAAEEYLYLNPQWKRICFDILAITLEPREYYLLEDVYFH